MPCVCSQWEVFSGGGRGVLKSGRGNKGRAPGFW